MVNAYVSTQKVQPGSSREKP